MQRNYRDILRQVFGKRRGVNPNYTLSQFSLDCGLSSNRMSDILNERYGISRANAEKMLKRLEIPDNQVEIFLLSVEAEHARSKSAREEAREKLKKILFTPDRVYSEAEFGLIFDWDRFAITELMRHPNFKNNIEWLAKKLDKNLSKIKDSIQKLINIGSISYFEGVYKVNAQFFATQGNVPSLHIKNYHKQVLKIAQVAIDRLPVNKRDFSSINFLCDPKQVPEIQKKIREFRQQLVSEYESVETDSELYMLNIQFFSPTNND